MIQYFFDIYNYEIFTDKLTKKHTNDINFF